MLAFGNALGNGRSFAVACFFGDESQQPIFPHFMESSHPIIRSAEPSEDWSWCYVDEVTFRFAPN
jgi:hypothetical protein